MALSDQAQQVAANGQAAVVVQDQIVPEAVQFEINPIKPCRNKIGGQAINATHFTLFLERQLNKVPKIETRYPRPSFNLTYYVSLFDPARENQSNKILKKLNWNRTIIRDILSL